MTIAEFFFRLATEPSLLERYREDAEGLLGDEEFGLDAEQRALLLTGDPRELRIKIKAEFHVEGQVVVYHTIYTVPTIYIPPPPPPSGS